MQPLGVSSKDFVEIASGESLFDGSADIIVSLALDSLRRPQQLALDLLALGFGHGFSVPKNKKWYELRSLSVALPKLWSTFSRSQVRVLNSC